MATDTNAAFTAAMQECRKVFAAKLSDYGPSWRIMRPQAITDQILIKARRIRSLQIKGFSAVGEGIMPEFKAIVNYGIIAVIQVRQGFADNKDIDNARALELYDGIAAEALELMTAKNHDYDEAWRAMRVESFVDIILTKLERIKEIEDHCGRTSVSEGVEGNNFDIVNYAVFGIIKFNDEE